ncbi:porin family protein [Rhodohalobacter halophilus]|uniref:porin family protein n=1 Tax=Rhodohalobacter halophilus TaxID=1812810 RepID=UPI00083F57D4|nr:porin family protein [Rhodohalobacter halophilus]
MRKLTSLLVVIFITTVMAQSVHAQSPVSFGLKAGMNISNLHGSDFEPDAKTGILLGAVLDINVPALPFGVESGVYYSQKGAELSGDNFESKIKLDYIEVPVMAKFQLGPPGPITPSLAVGPYLGFNVNAEEEFSSGGVTQTDDISDGIKGTEFGGVGALGLDFNLGLTKLNATARYSYGFTSVWDDSDVDSDRNAVFSIALGIMF